MSTSPAQDGVGGTEATSVEGLIALLALTGRPAQPRYVIIPILQVKKWSLGKVKELTEVTQLLGGGIGAETWKSHVRASAVLEGHSGGETGRWSAVRSVGGLRRPSQHQDSQILPILLTAQMSPQRAFSVHTASNSPMSLSILSLSLNFFRYTRHALNKLLIMLSPLLQGGEPACLVHCWIPGAQDSVDAGKYLLNAQILPVCLAVAKHFISVLH